MCEKIKYVSRVTNVRILSTCLNGSLRFWGHLRISFFILWLCLNSYKVNDLIRYDLMIVVSIKEMIFWNKEYLFMNFDIYLVDKKAFIDFQRFYYACHTIFVSPVLLILSLFDRNKSCSTKNDSFNIPVSVKNCLLSCPFY